MGDWLQTFLAMGGYGAFVWPAYGLTLLIMAGLAVASLRRLRRARRELERMRDRAAGDRP